MNKLYRLITVVVCLAALAFSPLAAAEEDGPRTGPTLSYYIGSSQLIDISGYNRPRSDGYQIGYQGRYLGITIGQNQLGKFLPSGSTPSQVLVTSNEALVNFRMYADYASLFLYAGISDWKSTSTTIFGKTSSSGSSPVVGLGIKIGNTIGLMLNALYYKSITDSDILNVNIGVNF